MADLQLRAVQISKHFQGVTALADVTLEVERGSIHGVVGPNGAGKTTLLNVMSGFLPPSQGVVELDGRDITRLTPQRRVPLGLTRTFQNLRLFGGLTVRENVLLGQHSRARTGFLSLWPFPGNGERELDREAEHALETFGLTEYRKRRAATLPYGLLKQLEIARAVAARPRLLLMDEPAAGMTAQERLDLVPRIRALRAEGLTVVIVEHDMEVIASVCDVVTVLNFGRKLVEGPPEVALASAEVRTAYLGT
ncbi:MAG: ABC transporter ATP-binding protein [Geodermatophilaceae bacterium]|nr:ABC transporter ATP-binding protein [Geodermatophilaceae bacterium]